MDRWKAEQGRGREKRTIRRENRRERVRRKKMQMREKVGKSRNTVFFQWFVAPEGRKVGGRRGTWRHGSSLCVAGMALMALGWLWWRAWVLGVAPWTPRLLAWQAWHLETSIFTFTWQAWHLATWILTLRGRRGTYGTGLALVARLGLSWRRGRRGFWRGRRGTWWHPPSRFSWQPWMTPQLTWRGRRGTWWHGPSLCVAGVALGDMDPHFAWQAWHLWHWAGSGGALGSQVGAVDAAAFGVAGVALGDMDLHFAWQVWHLATWILTLRGRRGTYGTGLALVARLVSGVAPWTPRLLAWQAWHLETSTFFSRGTWCVVLGGIDLWHWATLVRLGRCHVGAALFAWHTCDMDLHFVTHMTTCSHTSTHNLLTHSLSTHTCSTHTHTTWHRRSLCVAGVALGDMDLHFAWQVWHLVTWYLSVFITPMPPLRSWKK